MSRKRALNEAFHRIIEVQKHLNLKEISSILEPTLKRHSKLQVQWTSDFGYGVFAKEAISQGEAILEEKPWFSSMQLEWSGAENMEQIEKSVGKA